MLTTGRLGQRITNLSLFKTHHQAAAHTTNEREAAVPGDQVSLSGVAGRVKHSLRKLGIYGMAALALATALAPPVTAQTIMCVKAPCEVGRVVENHHHGSPFELLRHNGEVVINVGINDQVINPNRVETNYPHYHLPGANHAAFDQEGLTVCQQALNLGYAQCHGEDAATIQSPTGAVYVEQTGDYSLHVTNVNGVDIDIAHQHDGVDAKAQHPQYFVGGAKFYDNGHIGYY